MTYYDVYIGRLDDRGFDFEHGDRSGNIPHRRSPFFPGSSLGSGPFWEVIARINDGSLPGRQVDWGGWVARVTRDEVRQFTRETCGTTVPPDLQAFIEW